MVFLIPSCFSIVDGPFGQTDFLITAQPPPREMPLQSIILCRKAKSLTSADRNEILSASTECIHTGFPVCDELTLVDLLLNIACHPFDDEEFHIHLLRFDAARQEWVGVPQFRKVTLTTSPKPLPYLRSIPLQLPLHQAGVYAIHVQCYLESLSSIDPDPDSTVSYKFAVYTDSVLDLWKLLSHT